MNPTMSTMQGPSQVGMSAKSFIDTVFSKGGKNCYADGTPTRSPEESFELNKLVMAQFGDQSHAKVVRDPANMPGAMQASEAYHAAQPEAELDESLINTPDLDQGMANSKSKGMEM